jgi:DNA-directed RNA polymerase specialized sigma24 family protein
MADADGIWTAITRDQYIRALDSLPADFRAVFELRAYGQAYDQIAARLSISREAVSARLRAARALLRDSLLAPGAA